MCFSLPPCCLLQEELTPCYAKMSGATVEWNCRFLLRDVETEPSSETPEQKYMIRCKGSVVFPSCISLTLLRVPGVNFDPRGAKRITPDHRTQNDFTPPIPYTLGYSATSKSTDSFRAKIIIRFQWIDSFENTVVLYTSA